LSIEVGDTIPDVQIMTTTGGNPTQVQSRDVLGSGKVVLFGVPGAFTPTCSDYHLPSYVIRRQELVDKGVETVACISVNDAFVMDAWGNSLNVGDSVLMLADGNGEFAAAIGLEMDGSGFGLGSRSQRYAMVLEDGVVTVLNVEPGADAILEAL
jgi:peroxiredoxin